MTQRTDTELCNRALLKLGGAFTKKTITSYETDDSENGISCRLLLPFVKRDVLDSWDWIEATLYTELGNEVTLANKSDWLYAFNLPQDCVRVIKQTSEEDRTAKYESEQLDSYLLTNDLTNTAEDSAYIKYISDSIPVNSYSPKLFECMVVRLAIELAPTIQGNDKLAANLKQEYEISILPNARASNQKKTYEDNKGKATWLSKRKG